MTRSGRPGAGSAILLALAIAAGCGGEGGADRPADRPGGDTAAAPVTVPLTRIRVGGETVRVEIADEPEERQRGLMYRDSLPEDTGMLFVYPRERILSFWMRNTRIPLDIAYVDQRGNIVDVQTMAPQSDRLYESAAPAMYALELEAGWFEEHGVGVGDRIEF